MKIHVEDLAIEITRRCNMKCEHCLRGNAQALDLDISFVITLFSKIDSIGMLTITGGEPSLRPAIIEAIRQEAYKRHIDINDFYIATNGKLIGQGFIQACMDMYRYCGSNEMSQVQLSNDYYHMPFDMGKQWDNLDLFKFTSKKQRKDGESYGGGLIKQGRAKGWGSHDERTDSFDVYDDGDDNMIISEGILYLNCKGELIAGCNFSYTDQKNHMICRVDEDFVTMIQNNFIN